MEADPDVATLARSQAEPIIEPDRDMYARADQPSCAVRTTQLPHPYGAPLMHVRRLGPDGVFANFAEHFEAIWTTAHPSRTNDTN